MSLGMKKDISFQITREKHLDHMVRVVPFIVLCYAIQSFIIFKFSPSEFSSVGLSILGGFIALMIGGFILYDLKHRVKLFEDHLTIEFLFSSKTIKFEDIKSIVVKDPGQTFSNLIIITAKRKYTFYFIDDSEKIKKMIESKSQIFQMAA
jgi:hypothetical protein